ncbi:MAG: dihydroneopterin aldolase [Candidatus Marinimicrobia bacterium]|nr:dihydroneopterin aldolase [Candidatus Neomarinimicrobiota bacterium]|tara:strand:- start:1918 stop:2274 length:357 start_codon:yes stop_codon:yes gene_type:complete
MSVIKLKNMQFFGYHGVYDYEKEVGAPFEVDVEIETSFTRAIKSDDIDEAINYDAIFKLVNSIVSNKRFNLIETLSNTIGDQILSKFEIEKVLVRVRKPKVQINGILDTIEVEIEKSK